MRESLGGGTTHLLRVARTACQSAIAFLALCVGGELVSVISDAPSDETPRREDVVDDLVHQLWLDPGITHRVPCWRSSWKAARRRAYTAWMTCAHHVSMSVTTRWMGLACAKDMSTSAPMMISMPYGRIRR